MPLSPSLMDRREREGAESVEEKRGSQIALCFKPFWGAKGKKKTFLLLFFFLPPHTMDLASAHTNAKALILSLRDGIERLEKAEAVSF